MRLDHLLSKESRFRIPQRGMTERRIRVKFVYSVPCTRCFYIQSNGPIAQFWLERTPDKREVTGSIPVRPTSYCAFVLIETGELAQLGERLVCNQKVTGSIPVFSTAIEYATNESEGVVRSHSDSF